MPVTDGRTISINVKAMVDGLVGPMNQAKQSVKDFGATTQTTVAQVEASTERISRLWRAAFEAFIGVEAIKVLKDVALGAAEAAEELDVASRVARNFGNALNAAAMENWLQQFAKSAQGGGYAINSMREAIEQFAAVGLKAGAIQRALADTADLAAAHNMDFAQAVSIVRFALTGHVDMLTRYGIVSREAAKNIKTVDDAMRAIEKSSAGAASERANSLVGEFGRLATAASLLSDAIGKGLKPFFDELTAVLTNLANALASIPAPILEVVGTFAALGVSLVAVTLILPALAKGLTIVKTAFNLIGVVASPVLTFFGRLIPTLGLGTTGMEAFGASELAAMAPIAALVIAIAGIIVAVVELVNHLDHVKTAWHDWTQYLSDSFHEFTENFKRDQTVVLQLIEDIAGAIANPASAATYLARIPMLAPKSAIAEGPKLGHDDAQIGADIVGDWKKIASQVVGFFKSSIGNIKIPDAHFPGNIPGPKGKDTSAAAASNALKNFEERLKAFLETFQQKIDAAKAQIDIATEKLADFDVKHPADQAMSDSDRAARQSLVNQQVKAEIDLRNQTIDKANAENVAARQYLNYAREIPKALKNHDELLRSALDAAREHAKAARDLYLNYLQAGTALDTILAREREANNQRIDNAVSAQNDVAEQALAARNVASDIAGEDAGQSLAVDKARGRAVKPEAEDRLKIALDQLAVAAALDTDALKQNELARATAAYNQTKSIDDLNKLREAQLALEQSTLAVDRAENQRAADEAKLTADQQARWTQLIDDLIQKAGAPGLSSAAGVVSFNPLQFLVAAFEQSQTFADVMGTVNAIMKVFVQVFNAFRPVIDALLQVVRGVVNVFIFLYDAVAHILNLFGLQIPIIQALNSAFYDMVPLISVTHDIPTLNELAAGKLNNPLSTQPYGIQQLNQTTQSNDMKIIGYLVAILAAMIVAKVFSGMSLQQAVQQTLHLLGINVGQKVQTATQQMNNVLTTTTNAILTSGFASVVAAIEASQAASGAGGILGAILGIGGAAATGGASLGIAASQVTGALQTLGSAAQTVGSAFQSATRAVQSMGASVQRVTEYIDRSVSITTPITMQNPQFASDMDINSASAQLATNFLDRIRMGGYGLDRVTQ